MRTTNPIWRTLSRHWLVSLGLALIMGGQLITAQPLQLPGAPVIPVAASQELWIGVAVTPVPDMLRAQLDIPENQGLLVTSVSPGSPADKAGIKQHDVLLEAAGKPLTQVEELFKAVQEHKDKALTLKLLRKGKTETVEVTPEPRPAGGWEVPPVPKPLTDPKAWEKWLEEFRKQFPGGGSPFVFRFYHPGVVIPPDKLGEIPKNMTIVITKEGDKPAKIVVQKDGNKWEVTEKELDKLPPDVRPHVEKMLRGGGAMGGPALQPFPSFELRVPDLPKEPIRPWSKQPAGPAPRAENLEKRVKELEQRIKELEEKLRSGAPSAEKQGD